MHISLEFWYFYYAIVRLFNFFTHIPAYLAGKQIFFL